MANMDVVKAVEGIGMLGPQHPLAAFQCAAVERLGLAVAALGLVQEGQVVKAVEGIGMLGAQHPLGVPAVLLCQLNGG